SGKRCLFCHFNTCGQNVATTNPFSHSTPVRRCASRTVRSTFRAYGEPWNSWLQPKTGRLETPGSSVQPSQPFLTATVEHPGEEGDRQGEVEEVQCEAHKKIL